MDEGRILRIAFSACQGDARGRVDYPDCPGCLTRETCNHCVDCLGRSVVLFGRFCAIFSRAGD